MKKNKWLVLGLIAIIILLVVVVVYSPSGTSKNVAIGDLKDKINCSCGCDYSLNDCAKYDPSCGTRPGIISDIQKMKDQGKSDNEILAAFGEAGVSALNPSSVVDVSADDDPVKGNKNAPVTIIGFSDFQCPYCASFYSQTLSQLEEEYVKTGKVKFVYRDYPLSFHQYAQKAAEAGECADEQGKFWEYHDLLFENQQKWSEGGIPEFKKYAKELGLNSSKFDLCLDSGQMTSEVQKDFQDGNSYGVSGTPAFFINGELLSGAQPIGAFRQAIDKNL